MLIHPRVAHDRLNGISWTYAESLPMAYGKSDGRIFCIFPSDHHWAFLWGQQADSAAAMDYRAMWQMLPHFWL